MLPSWPAVCPAQFPWFPLLLAGLKSWDTSTIECCGEYPLLCPFPLQAVGKIDITAYLMCWSHIAHGLPSSIMPNTSQELAVWAAEAEQLLTKMAPSQTRVLSQGTDLACFVPKLLYSSGAKCLPAPTQATASLPGSSVSWIQPALPTQLRTSPLSLLAYSHSLPPAGPTGSCDCSHKGQWQGLKAVSYHRQQKQHLRVQLRCWHGFTQYSFSALYLGFFLFSLDP